MAYKKGKPHGRRRKKKDLSIEFDPNKIYLEGVIVDSLPGTRFQVKVNRSEGLDPLVIDCKVRTIFKLKKIRMIRGDSVTVEVDPNEDLTKGVIVMLKRSFTNPRPQK